MKPQKIKILLGLLLCHIALYGQQNSRLICRQGKVSFFSYTAVENIEATNNQVLSVFDSTNGEIVVKMLMRAFVFKKALMEEHFNESYVESDIYPELTFTGNLKDFNPTTLINERHFITGIMDFHGVQKEVELKMNTEKNSDNLVFAGDFNVSIDDFNIKVPTLLEPNIAKEIQVMFRFEYTPYEK